jgi:hypothetical protein
MWYWSWALRQKAAMNRNTAVNSLALMDEDEVSLDELGPLTK